MNMDDFHECECFKRQGGSQGCSACGFSGWVHKDGRPASELLGETPKLAAERRRKEKKERRLKELMEKKAKKLPFSYYQA